MRSNVKQIALSLIVLIAIVLPKTSLGDDDQRSGSQCGLSLSVSNVNLVWSMNLPTQQITFTVRKSRGMPCSYLVTFSRGSASNYNSRAMTSGSSTLRYQLYGDSSLTSVLKDYPDFTTHNEVIAGSFGGGPNHSQSLTYYLQIPLNLATTPRLKPSGNYVDTFVMKIFRDQTHLSSPEDTQSVQLRTLIPKNIELSLVPSGSSFNSGSTMQALNFGTLIAGATRSLDMRVLTNAGYVVTVSSQNNGVLKHSVPGVTTTIPYQLSVNGVPKNLSSSQSQPVQVASGSGQTTVDGAVNTIDVRIDDVTNKMAGNYSDIITVTAATTE
jgi:spore coat protein U-like protein